MIYSPFVLNEKYDNFNTPKVNIIDPITKHNVAKMSFRILDVKFAFEQAYYYLNQYTNLQKEEGVSSFILNGLFNILKH